MYATTLLLVGAILSSVSASNRHAGLDRSRIRVVHRRHHAKLGERGCGDAATTPSNSTGLGNALVANPNSNTTSVTNTNTNTNTSNTNSNANTSNTSNNNNNTVNNSGSSGTSQSGTSGNAASSCNNGDWQCVGTALQMCDHTAWVTMANCVGDNIVCSASGAVGCVWSYQASSGGVSSGKQDGTSNGGTSGNTVGGNAATGGTSGGGTTTANSGTPVVSTSTTTPLSAATQANASTGSSNSTMPTTDDEDCEDDNEEEVEEEDCEDEDDVPSAAVANGTAISTSLATTTTAPANSTAIGQALYAGNVSVTSASSSHTHSSNHTSHHGSKTSSSVSATASTNGTVANNKVVSISSASKSAAASISAASKSAAASISAASKSAAVSISVASKSAAASISAASISASASISAAAASASAATNTTVTPLTKYSAPHWVIYSDYWLFTMPTVTDLKSYNRFILAFWMSNNGPVDNAQAWAWFDKSYRDQVLKSYHDAGIALMVSAFGSTDAPTSWGMDPVKTAQNLAQYVKDYGLDGVDIDYEDMSAMNSNKAEAWLIPFQQELRRQLPSPYIISHAPVAPWFTSANDYKSGAYVAIHQAVGSGIDFYNIQFYNQGNGVYTTCNNLIFNSGNGWPSTSVMEINSYSKVPMEKIVIGKPLDTGAADNGYMSPSTLNGCVKQAQAKGWNGGVMFWEWTSAAPGIMATVRG